MSSAARITKPVPPLCNGDHLTVEEFERRYEAMPEVKKAELINGVVYMGSPVTIDDHGRPHARLITWLGTYEAFTEGVEVADNSTMKLEIGANQPQPDGLLRIAPHCGGNSKTRDKYVIGAAELAAEVSASSKSLDLFDKLVAYQLNHVSEYIIWRVNDEAIDWYRLHAGKFRELPLRDGIYKSKVFPGLWLDPQALIAGDMARVLAVVQQGIASPEHGRFVAKLRKRMRPPSDQR